MKIEPYIRKTYYYETDRMGIIHHSNYIRYFEEARLAAMEQIGFDCAKMEEENVIIPVVDVYAKYRRSLRLGDEFKVLTRMTEFNGTVMHFEYEIRFTRDDTLACTGNSSHCFVNSSGMPYSIKRKRPDIYEKFLSLIEE